MASKKISNNKLPEMKRPKKGEKFQKSSPREVLSYTKDLDKLAKHLWTVSANNGFHSKPVPLAIMITNIHAELSELWEAYRGKKLHKFCDKAGKMTALGLRPLTCFEEELADILIRVLDTAYENQVNLVDIISIKDQYNQTRPYMHSKKC